MTSAQAFAQTNFITDSTGIVADTLTNDTIYSFAQEMPDYPGGDAALQAFLMTNVKWPKDIGNNGSVPPSTYLLYWVVEKNGTVSHAGVELPNPLSNDLKQEFIRVINSMSGFRPGRLNGEPVRVRMMCPMKVDWRF